jgi:hypothetical protein
LIALQARLETIGWNLPLSVFCYDSIC